MEYTGSLKRLTLMHLEPHMPIAIQQTDALTGRTFYPEIDPPSDRLKEYQRREASINLSTERSMNLEPFSQEGSPKKMLLFPMPNKSKTKALDLSIGDLSRKNTESAQSDNQNAYEGG